MEDDYKSPEIMITTCRLSEPDESIANFATLLSHQASEMKEGNPIEDEMGEGTSRPPAEPYRKPKRTIFRFWPRDPAGKPILSTKGKEAPNDNPLWGATLADFYFVSRFPDIKGLATITTGSKLAAWMKENKETKYCAEELRWAEMEADPVEIHPADVGKLIDAAEMRIRMGFYGKKRPAQDYVPTEDEVSRIRAVIWVCAEYSLVLNRY